MPDSAKMYNSIPVYDEIAGLKVAKDLRTFVRERLAHASLSESDFWTGYASILGDLAPENKRLLEERGRLQSKVATFFFRVRNGTSVSVDEQKPFLEKIGYLVPEPPNFAIGTAGVDPEFSEIAGPQLVVPLSNPRYALNALNARWGSLYDALYGTNVIEQPECTNAEYDNARKRQVITWTAAHLDEAIPLATGVYREVKEFRLAMDRSGRRILRAILKSGAQTELKNPSQFQGYLGPLESPSTLLFVKNGLHIELQIDANNPVGELAFGNVKDVILESAVTVIQDLEDSVAVVDTEDKLKVYRNWAGLLDGDLTVNFVKAGRTVHRRPSQDRLYLDVRGDSLRLKGRSVMLIRHVGLLSTTECVLDDQERETPEGVLDAVVTALCSLRDVYGVGGLRNSANGKIYAVKPKMHGPDEAAFVAQLFSRVEDLLSLPRNTICMGIMDEERRTSMNLSASIRAAKDRVVFINTGFLDRTGDEVHTGSEFGVAYPRDEMKSASWYVNYEKRNVRIGLAAGFQHKAQIGKGMWPMPDNMLGMLNSKQAHPEAGANCAWVPSPTAATLHAIHYHRVQVESIQSELKDLPPISLQPLMELPFEEQCLLSGDALEKEVRNYAQGILGYVVRWVDQGIGCSTIPDINGVGLMEDRATLRITSQILANWLKHDVITKADILRVFRDVVPIIDMQNSEDEYYKRFPSDPMQSVAFRAALDLVLRGGEQPNGYTDLVLKQARIAAKRNARALSKEPGLR